MLFETSLTSTPVFGLRRDMNRLFDDMLARTAPSSSWAPPVDVREDDGAISITAELPGVNPDNVEVTSDAGVLTIRGQKTEERKEGQEGQYHLVERTFGSFSRSFRLPKGVDESKITATFDQGVLKVQVPKAALPQPKKIAIDSGNSNGGNPKVRGEGSNQSSAGAQQNAQQNTRQNSTQVEQQGQQKDQHTR